MQETQSSDHMSTSLLRLAALGRAHPERCFTNINQYLTKDLLRAAFYQTRSDGAVGIDGQTAADYAEHLDDNLESLLSRAKSGRYVAPPVRRAYIPKGTGRRPIGIPTFEDKVLQRAVVMLLERLYEPIFHGHSFGYRPRRSAHQALELLRQELGQEGGHIVELDIQAFFDHLDKRQLRGFLQQRIGDGVILRLINKWLKAGVMERGTVHYPEQGSPQGGVISPILANVYLHHVLDLWFEREVRPRLMGRSCLVRFADDAVIILRNAQDASRVRQVLPKRFTRYGLTLHPDKTCVKAFKPLEKSSFDFLGFTHYWKKTHKGYWRVFRKTMKARFARGVKAIADWCQTNRHKPLTEQLAKLSQKLRGHYAYFGISGNIASLRRYRYVVENVWVKWLKRRSQRHRLTNERIQTLLKRYALPTARILTSSSANVMS